MYKYGYLYAFQAFFPIVQKPNKRYLIIVNRNTVPTKTYQITKILKQYTSITYTRFETVFYTKQPNENSTILKSLKLIRKRPLEIYSRKGQYNNSVKTFTISNRNKTENDKSRYCVHFSISIKKTSKKISNAKNITIIGYSRSHHRQCCSCVGMFISFKAHQFCHSRKRTIM